jgi:hypothetical protein
LEDRWYFALFIVYFIYWFLYLRFDGRWQDWGRENLLTPGQDPNDKTKVCY